jgi:hypothetical protein
MLKMLPIRPAAVNVAATPEHGIRQAVELTRLVAGGDERTPRRPSRDVTRRPREGR